jgi:hypothetical protein
MTVNFSQKPNWEESPPWARTIAQDCNGQWFWYERMPKLSLLGYWEPNGGRSQLACEGDPSDTPYMEYKIKYDDGTFIGSEYGRFNARTGRKY